MHSHGRRFEPHAILSGAFQTELARISAQPPDFYEVPLVSALEGGGATEAAAAEYLRTLDAEHPFDLVVAVGASATRFAQQNHASLFPGAPLLISGTDRRHIAEGSLAPSDATVPIAVDLPAIFENVLAVLPDTNRIEVVVGTSPLERFWREEIEKASSAFAGRVEFAFLDQLPFEKLVEHVGSLPPRTAVFYSICFTDAAGIPLRDLTALTAIREASRSPIFGVFDFQLGRGIVGGPLIPLQELAVESAGVAARLLRGEDPASLRLTPVGPSAPAFDARELARFGIDASRLPAGSRIEFRTATLWETYRWRIVGVAVLIVGQTLLIAGLLVHRSRLSRASAAVRDLTGRLVTAQEEERRRLARELHDDVSQRLARLAIDAGRLERDAPDEADAEPHRRIREGLASVSEDVHALSYRLHPSLLEDLGLAEALQVECDRFSQQSAVRANLAVRDVPEELPMDVSLCLFRVAQEALRNVERHARARNVNVALEGRDGGLRLSIRDDGVGLDPSKARGRGGIGLASMRERVLVFAGAFEIESAPNGGTTIRAVVPIAGAGS